MQGQWIQPTKSVTIGSPTARLPPGMSEADELLCYGELGLELSKNNPAGDHNELRKIVFEYLRYPCSELAELHAECNRLGMSDVISEEGDPLANVSNRSEDIKVCSCCGFKHQPDTIPLYTPLKSISGLGSSTILLFEDMSSFIWMLLIAGVVYSLYAVNTSMKLAGDSCPSITNCKVLAISLHPKFTSFLPESRKFYQTQSLLGVVLVVLWGVWFMRMNYRQRQLTLWTDRITASASDFTVQIDGLAAEINQEIFQTILNEYRKEVDPNSECEPLQMVRFNVAEPYYVDEDDLQDAQLQSLKRQRRHLQEVLRGWLRQRRNGDGTSFQRPQEERSELYSRFEQLNDKIKDRVHEVAYKVKERYLTNRANIPSNTVFVTFRHSSSQHLVVNNNQSSMERLRAYLLCRGYGKMRLPLLGITVQRAPEPQDVIFANMGAPQEKIMFRKFLTYLAAFVIVCLTFGVLFVLKFLRRQQNNHALSIITSVVITIVNFYLAIAIRKLIAYERNTTRIQSQRSQSIKIIVSQIANMAFLPYLQNVILDSNIYGKGGLAEVVFYMALTNALLTPALKLLDYRGLLRKIRRWYYNDPQRKLYLNQKALNQLFDGKNFEVGNEYIYPVKTMVFTSFYLSLQPSIAFISALGIFLMYWVNKYVLLQRGQRPPPGTDIIHHTLCQFIFMCPLLFCIGSSIWPYLTSSQLDAHSHHIGVGISLVLFLLPLEEIFGSIVKGTHDNMVYEQQRIRFSAEYDRRNPATKKRAELEYRNYLDDYQRNLAKDSTKSEAQKLSLFKLVERDMHNIINPYKSERSMELLDIGYTNDFQGILAMASMDQFSSYAAQFPQMVAQPIPQRQANPWKDWQSGGPTHQNYQPSHR